MSEIIGKFFVEVFGNNVALATVLISMMPVIELRGAIPFATNSNFWSAKTLSNWSAYGWGALGSSAIVPILALLFFPLMKLLKKIKCFRKIANGIENSLTRKAESIGDVNQECKIFSSLYWKKFVAIFIFVAVPLPLTGVWTGTCLALFIGLDYASSCCSVIVGNLIAGFIITIILEFFPALNNWLFYIFLILIFVVALYSLIKHLIHRKNNKNQ